MISPALVGQIKRDSADGLDRVALRRLFPDWLNWTSYWPEARGYVQRSGGRTWIYPEPTELVVGEIEAR